MGMRTQLAAKQLEGTQGTSSYPVTGMPATAYLGNNRRVGGGNQSRPSAIAGGLGSVSNFNQNHLLITLGGIVLIGFIAWHLDNK
jgi:hypothetical protein